MKMRKNQMNFHMHCDWTKQLPIMACDAYMRWLYHNTNICYQIGKLSHKFVCYTMILEKNSRFMTISFRWNLRTEEINSNFWCKMAFIFWMIIAIVVIGLILLIVYCLNIGKKMTNCNRPIRSIQSSPPGKIIIWCSCFRLNLVSCLLSNWCSVISCSEKSVGFGDILLKYELDRILI